MGFPGVTPVSDESIGETIVKKMVENTPDFAYTAASLAALGLTGYAAVKTAPAVVGGVKGATSRLIPKRTAKKTATRAATRFIPGTTTKAVAGTAERLAARAAPRVAERQFFQQSAQRAASTVTRAAPKVLHPEMGARITEMMGKKTTARTAQRVGGRALLKNLGGRVATRAIPGIGTALLVADVGATIYEGITRRDVGGQYLGFGDVLGFTQKPGISRKAEGAFARAGISQDQYKKLLSRGMSPAQINQLIAKQRGA